MFSCCEKKEVFETPFGDLEGDDLNTAMELYIIFYDQVCDGTDEEYLQARKLFADPQKFHGEMEEQQKQEAREEECNIDDEERSFSFSDFAPDFSSSSSSSSDDSDNRKKKKEARKLKRKEKEKNLKETAMKQIEQEYDQMSPIRHVEKDLTLEETQQKDQIRQSFFDRKSESQEKNSELRSLIRQDDSKSEKFNQTLVVEQESRHLLGDGKKHSEPILTDRKEPPIKSEKTRHEFNLYGDAESTHSDFSASFYGPIPTNKVETPLAPPSESESVPSDEFIKGPDSEVEENELEIDRYFYVYEDCEEQFEVKYNPSHHNDRIRFFLFNNADKRDQICLHVAAKNGSKNFVAFIIYESEKLGFVDEIVDKRNFMNLTPLFMVCEYGYRPPQIKRVMNDNDIQLADFNPLDSEELEYYQDKLAKDYIQELEDKIDWKRKKPPVEGEENGPAKKDREIYLDFYHRLTNQQIFKLIKNGIWYMAKHQMRKFKDDECKSTSRCFIVKVLLEYGADPNVQSRGVKHTPIHWLAFQGDHRALKQVLQYNRIDTVQILDPEFIKDRDKFYRQNGALNAFKTSNGQTPADIAGDLNHFMCLKHILKYFYLQQNMIRDIFLTQEVKDKYGVGRYAGTLELKLNGFKPGLTEPQMIELEFLYAKNLNTEQKSFLSLAYWCVFLANEKDSVFVKQFLYIFIHDIGVSPFIKCYRKASIMHGCVRAKNINIFQELLMHRYQVRTKEDKQKFIASCTNKDDVGNNIMHEIFMVPQSHHNMDQQVAKSIKKDNMKKKIQQEEAVDENRNYRFEFTQIVCKYPAIVQWRKIKDGCCSTAKVNPNIDPLPEELEKDDITIGDLEKRNRRSYLPHEMEHTQPIRLDSRIVNLKFQKEGDEEGSKFKMISVSGYQADYIICCTDTENDKKSKIVESQLRDLMLERNKDYFIFTKNKSKNPKDSYQVYIAIRFTGNMIDDIAHQKKIYCDLDVMGVKSQYNKFANDEFTCFDSRQRYQAIFSKLYEEIDIDYFVQSGIIDEHYPLHKFEAASDIIQSLNKYQSKLSKRMILGPWQKYMEPIHLQKRYLGERYAFHFLFFMHYQAWLIVPAFFGMILWIFQIVGNELDTYYNAYYGLFLAIWSSLFVDSWRRKQEQLIDMWDLGSVKDVYVNDERDGEFLYMYEYNPVTNEKQKSGMKPSIVYKYLNVLFILVMSSVVFAVCYYFENNGYDTETDADASSIAEGYFEELIDPETIIYTLTIQLIGYIFDYGTEWFVKKCNYQFHSDYNDAILNQLIIFNCINTFFPFFFIAFIKQSFISLFTILIFTIVIDQAKESLTRFIERDCKYYWKRIRYNIKSDMYRLDESFTIQEQIENQVKWNVDLIENETSVQDEYMTLVMQYSIIILFGTVMPGAPFVCLMINAIQFMLNRDIQYTRRTLPQISLGIGQFLPFMEFMSMASVAINCGIAAFTSENQINLISGLYDLIVSYLHSKDTDGIEGTESESDIDENVSKIYIFLLFLVIVEHSALMIKFAIPTIVDFFKNTSASDIRTEQRIKQTIINQHRDKKDRLATFKKKKIFQKILEESKYDNYETFRKYEKTLLKSEINEIRTSRRRFLRSRRDNVKMQKFKDRELQKQQRKIRMQEMIAKQLQMKQKKIQSKIEEKQMRIKLKNMNYQKELKKIQYELHYMRNHTGKRQTDKKDVTIDGKKIVVKYFDDKDQELLQKPKH